MCIKFIIENVYSMDESDKDYFDSLFGVMPVCIQASELTRCHRERSKGLSFYEH